MTAPDPAVADVVFDVAGTLLPADNAWPLLQEIERRLPWLESEVQAGVHPLRAAPTSNGLVLLAQRAKLVLRMPETRLEECRTLEDALLDIAGRALRVGAGRPRGLRPSATLHAHRVAADTDDNGEFECAVGELLRALEIDCEYISGGRRTGRAGGRTISGFALALHDLRPADSLHIQAVGIGSDRPLGWGIFVPAKEIAAA